MVIGAAKRVSGNTDTERRQWHDNGCRIAHKRKNTERKYYLERLRGQEDVI